MWLSLSMTCGWFVCRATPVRHCVRMWRQDSEDRVQGWRVDQLDPSQLRSLLHHHLQRPWQHRVVGQLHVAQVSSRPSQQVSICYPHIVLLYLFYGTTDTYPLLVNLAFPTCKEHHIKTNIPNTPCPRLLMAKSSNLFTECSKKNVLFDIVWVK